MILTHIDQSPPVQLNIYYFRTEMEADIHRASMLLDLIGVTYNVNIQQDGPVVGFNLGYFTCLTPMSFDEFKSEIQHQINTDSRFVDLHRCYQTLSIGNT